MILSKYATALLQLALVAIAALQTAQVDGITWTEGWQLAGLVVGAFVTYFAPILEKGWAAALKVGGAVIGAIIAAVVPLLLNDWTAQSWIIVILAGLNALAAQAGVSIRLDSAASAIASPVVANAVPETVDPVAVSAAFNRGV